jgi:hypothetical protein
MVRLHVTPRVLCRDVIGLGVLRAVKDDVTAALKPSRFYRGHDGLN